MNRVEYLTPWIGAEAVPLVISTQVIDISKLSFGVAGVLIGADRNPDRSQTIDYFQRLSPALAGCHFNADSQSLSAISTCGRMRSARGKGGATVPRSSCSIWSRTSGCRRSPDNRSGALAPADSRMAPPGRLNIDCALTSGRGEDRVHDRVVHLSWADRPCCRGKLRGPVTVCIDRANSLQFECFLNNRARHGSCDESKLP